MNKQKGMSKKTVTYIIAAFLLILVGGVVFAATTGILTINGSVSRGDSVDLDFTAAVCNPVGVTTNVEPGAGVTLAGAPGGDYNCGVALSNGLNAANGVNDVLTWGIFLREPGDSQAINFSIKNVGSVPVDLAALSVDTSTGFGAAAGEIELTGTALNIAAQCLDPDEVVGPFTINVHWPTADTSATGGGTFTATMNYAQAATSSCP